MSTRLYEKQRARELALYVTKAARVVREVGERWIELHGLVPAGSGGSADGPSGPAHAGPRVPVRVDVIDLMREVEAFVERFVPTVRGTLRMGLGSTRSVPTGVAFLAESLPGVYEQDPDLGDEVARDGFRLHHRTGVVLGIVSGAYRLEAECHECGMQSLWLEPESATVACGMPGCGGRWPLSASRLVHSSATSSQVGG